jgi:hypothetical protein
MGEPYLQLWFSYGSEKGLVARYKPINTHGLPEDEWGGGWVLLPDTPDPNQKELLARVDRLFRLVPPFVPAPLIPAPGGDLRPQAEVVRIRYFEEKPDLLGGQRVYGHVSVSDTGAVVEDYRLVDFEIPRTTLPMDGQRLLDDILASVESRSWSDLRKRTAGTSSPDTRIRALISYSHRDDRAAEALARRLGVEGLVPWFDKWEIRAGDSLPGKIEEGFNTTDACLVLWSAAYPKGKWCTEEMETAINKRVETGYRIIPVKLDQTPLPGLLAKLRYVDLSDWNRFEEGIREIVQSIFGLELNPYR